MIPAPRPLDPFAPGHTDDRIEPRDEVLFRTRVTLPDHRVVAATLVNLSPHGLMARVDRDIAAGEWVQVALPLVGAVAAGVRWSLGGRIGCALEHEIAPAAYHAILAAARPA